MNNRLVETIQDLAQTLAVDFASAVVKAVTDLPISELARALPAPRRAAGEGRAKKEPKGKSGRLQRRTPKQIAAVGDDVVAFLKKHPDGVRSEQIREGLGLDKREVPRVLQQAIADGKIKILHGEKRATTYGAGKGGKSPRKAKPAKAARKAKAKPVKRAAKKKASAKAKPAQAARKGKKASKKGASAKRASNGVSAPATAAAPAE